jgi:uncharacterized protein YjbJ (UPF0337 family)
MPITDMCGEQLARQPVVSAEQSEETTMHKDEIEGAGKQAKGAIKDAVGGLTGDEKLQAEGKLDKVEGKVQSKVGEVKDRARDALKK